MAGIRITLPDHYKEFAERYDAFYEPYHHCAVNFILNHIPFHPEDIVIDIGGGTGELAHRIWKHVGLNHPVLCVDPSEDMLVSATKKDGVVSVCATAEEFFLSHNEQFDKALICGCMHLFSDLKAVFTGLKEKLSDSGTCIIIITSDFSLLFSTARAALKSITKPEAELELLDSIGLQWTHISKTEQCTIKKTQWYAALRSRFMSFFGRFTDEEIEEGILELERECPSQDHLELCIVFEAFVVTKKTVRVTDC